MKRLLDSILYCVLIVVIIFLLNSLIMHDIWLHINGKYGVLFSSSDEILPGYFTNDCPLYSSQVNKCGLFLDIRSIISQDNINHYFKDQFYPLVRQLMIIFVITLYSLSSCNN